MNMWRRFFKARQDQRTLPFPIPYEPKQHVEDVFWKAVGEKLPSLILEVGTLQAVPGRSTHSMARFPGVTSENYVRLDMIGGADVDVVGDLHCLPEEWNSRFDCFLANAVFEHLERPWIAAKEVARTLAPGGMFFIATHQCFPIHGYPSDFFRFSDSALRLILEDAGLIVDACDYSNRCMIIPPSEIVLRSNLANWNTMFPSYIHVSATGRKPL